MSVIVHENTVDKIKCREDGGGTDITCLLINANVVFFFVCLFLLD